jgi:hypothetical protein
MTEDKYLTRVLEDQTLEEDGSEMKSLRQQRKAVDVLLTNQFAGTPKIRYGGSKAKGTMIRESYDLDIHCCFDHDETIAGDTLRDIYDNVAKALDKSYLIERKRSALRLTSKDPTTRGSDLHIDVVPGRFIDGDHGDVFLFQNESSKERLQTNLQVQIDHIHGSGVTDPIRLFKLWKVRQNLAIKTFALELLIVDLLKGHKDIGIDQQARLVLLSFRDCMDELTITDPANPTGNDLSELLNATVRFSLRQQAIETLNLVDTSGWQTIFGRVSEGQESDRNRLQQLQHIAMTSAMPTKPWGYRQ